MLCERCGTLPAQVRIMTKSASGVTSAHVCQACAEEITRHQFQTAFGSLTAAGAVEREKPTSPACPVCAIKLRQYANAFS